MFFVSTSLVLSLTAFSAAADDGVFVRFFLKSRPRSRLPTSFASAATFTGSRGTCRPPWFPRAPTGTRKRLSPVSTRRGSI